MEILPSARKHGITAEDILHALSTIVRYREQEYDGESRVFIIGSDRVGRLLELVLVPAHEPMRVIHADILRPHPYSYLGTRL
jgi:uncharacterized DUF497 family protein